jgi:Putative Flp pilus-assembly TadE/G-like
MARRNIFCRLKPKESGAHKDSIRCTASKNGFLSAIADFISDDRGQMLPLLAVAFLVLLGTAGFGIDVGRVYYCSRALQQNTDAAALAGAGSMHTASSTSEVIAAATAMSGVNGSENVRSSVPNVTFLSGYPALKCLSTLQSQGMACAGSVPYNSIQVQEQSVVPMYFASFFGYSTMTTTARSTASVRGGAPTPSNIAIVVDTTLSMASPDSNCGSTQIQCALSGIQTLLQTLNPCAASLSACQVTNGVAANSVDRVALFTFPNVSASTVSLYLNCTSAVPSPTLSNRYWNTLTFGYTINYVMPTSPLGLTPVTPWPTLPAAMAYSYPTAAASAYNPSQANNATYPMTLGTATYQVTPFLSDYRVSNGATTLNQNSQVVRAVGGATGCGGMAPPNYAGVFGTYYAGAIYAAQSALLAQQAVNSGTNIMIILGDGDNNSPAMNGLNVVMGLLAGTSGIYPSYLGECGQAVTAAQYATKQGTKVYSVAYGSPVLGCLSDLLLSAYPGITPCQTMANMASAPQYFYSDYLQAGSFSNCVSGQSVTALSDIFNSIAHNLSTARLIPDGTT